jgi:hypothetical protein
MASAQVSTGEEGFLNQPDGATSAEDGTVGVDFASNTQDPNIAFGCVHLCEGPRMPCLA